MKAWFRRFRARYSMPGLSLQRVHLGLEIVQFFIGCATVAILVYLWLKKRGERS